MSCLLYVPRGFLRNEYLAFSLSLYLSYSSALLSIAQNSFFFLHFIYLHFMYWANIKTKFNRNALNKMRIQFASTMLRGSKKQRKELTSTFVLYSFPDQYQTISKALLIVKSIPPTNMSVHSNFNSEGELRAKVEKIYSSQSIDIAYLLWDFLLPTWF